MKRIPLVAAGLLALGVTGIASADQFEDAIAYRTAAFKLMKANVGPMGAMAQGKVPFDKQVFVQRAANLDAIAGMPWEYFIEGSDVGETKAKPEVWSKAADYKAAIDKFRAETAKLAQFATTGDENAIKAQFSVATKNCKSCHDAFKNK